MLVFPFPALRYIKALETMRQLRLKKGQIVRECQVELRYLKQMKEKALQIEEMLAAKEAQLMASRDSVQRVEGQIEPLEVGQSLSAGRPVRLCLFVQRTAFSVVSSHSAGAWKRKETLQQ